ncbi:TM269 protein, partial [Neopipo cinnamomea]|nr:TM269 protein [Neopipo cinnamomea]
MWMVSPPVGVFQAKKKKIPPEREGRERALEFKKKKTPPGLSVANLLAGLKKKKSPPNRQYQLSCWLLKKKKPPPLADGAVARQLDACSALGKKKKAPPDFTTFGLGTALKKKKPPPLGGLLALAYVLAVFARLCFFSSAGIPFTYRGLPCKKKKTPPASTFLLSGGHVKKKKIPPGAMILGMADCGSYPHDRVLESQRWKKAVYKKRVAAVLLAPEKKKKPPRLAWATSYIVFPFALWSCKA